MLKKGQITIFLVVAIVILFIFAGSVFMFSKLKTAETRSETQGAGELLYVEPQITSYVENCLYDVAIPGIYLLSIQGGTIYPEDPATVLLAENGIINYGYLDSADQLSIEEMEEQLDLYIKQQLPLCIQDFYFFADQGLTISTEDITANSVIGIFKVFLSVDYKTEIVKGDDELVINSYSTSVPLHLGKAVNKAKEIIERYGNNLSISSVENDYFITTFPFDGSTIIYSLSDNVSEVENAPLTFMFAIMDEEMNTPPVLDFIPNLVIRKGEPFTYQLRAEDAEDDSISYFVTPSLFPIEEHGLINEAFSDAGEFDLLFTATDFHGLTDQQEVRLTVNE
jgi:hypothetical protein